MLFVYIVIKLVLSVPESITGVVVNVVLSIGRVHH